MQQRQKGQIALMGSLAGFRGLAGAPAYCASKAAIRLYGESLRCTLATDNIGVTIITPGFIKTPLTDVNKFPMPFLMSADKAAHYIKKKLPTNPPRIAFPYIMYIATLLLTFLPLRLTDWIMRTLPQKGAR